jgi:hypothetical protein
MATRIRAVRADRGENDMNWIGIIGGRIIQEIDGRRKDLLLLLLLC